MKRLALLLLVTISPGCAVYTVANTASYAISNKTITDKVATRAVPNSDCNFMNVLNGLYYCEIRDISQTYNRNSY